MRALVDNLRRLAVGLVAIAGASATLLGADLGSRRGAAPATTGAAPVPRVALVQHASLEAIDDGVQGVVDALAQRGFRAGETVQLSRYNAQGDVATANAIARQVVADPVDLVVSISTISLQTVASANRSQSAPRRHVFGLVTNPLAAGVGVTGPNPSDHPPYLAGLGSLPPVRELFELVLQVRPTVRRIGLVWNPAESNSEAATKLARTVSGELGLTLVEGNAESATAAGEVTRAVLARGVDVLWLGPDITVTTAVNVVVEAARREGVPVVSSIPALAEKGAILALGANYEDLGFVVGMLAADVLDGRDPATIPVVSWMPVELHVNLEATRGLRDPWAIPDAVVRRARVVTDAAGTRRVDQPAPMPPESLRWQRESR